MMGWAKNMISSFNCGTFPKAGAAEALQDESRDEK